MTPLEQAASRKASRVSIRAHAKINLSLQVTGVRPDGYHLLKTVFQSLALHDLLRFEAWDGPFVLSCSAPDVPTDSRNLVWRAASLLWECAGRQGAPGGVRARVVKRIPAQGGLGGGSADAAAALVALDALWGTGLGPDRLRALAIQIGADVPFFLAGGTALGLDRGDDIFPLADLAAHAVVLVFPPFGVSTPEAFRWLDEDGAAGRRLDPASEEPAVLRFAGDVPLSVHNALQGPVGRRHPEIEEICGRLRDAGAAAAAMTGSGSTVFGLFGPGEDGRAAAAALESAGWRALATRTASRRQAAARSALSGRGPLV
jgi:4-diphosphocytidyl-2-C-methyl-D-erythritol kinase